MARTPGCLARGELRWAGSHLGEGAIGPGQRRYLVFRDTSRVPGLLPEADPEELVVLRAWFVLPWLGPAGTWRHRAFRRCCVVTFPLFSGLEGYRTKLWLSEVAGPGYLGIYQWRGEEAGRAYLDALEPLLRVLSSRGSVGTEVIAGARLDAFVGPEQVRAR